MELFYAYKVSDGFAFLDAEESGHCVRVLRHRVGDAVEVIDGSGSLLHCELSDASPKEAVARVVSETPGWGAHPYHLTMAVCPTKNIDRYEWFVEKATELGVDEIVPVIGDHSERRVVRVDRLRKIAVAGAKQSLKGAVPIVSDVVSVYDFIGGSTGIKLIAYCSDDVAARGSIVEILSAAAKSSAAGKGQVPVPEKKGSGYLHSPTDRLAPAAAASVTILIGPEGDFSREEVRAALDAGFVPVHLGSSRLRTETAALTAVEAVYFSLGCTKQAYESND
ncbi:MAG: 16S rRNA (uracil(1498)-N(3))-methyltransferase [Bacteroidales bacterium]|nr:16S rRNA (uracil(1498)-N(3))-methyltransferase [Bacteroidales bacterium]